jgi:UPF0716 protein FxsA
VELFFCLSWDNIGSLGGSYLGGANGFIRSGNNAMGGAESLERLAAGFVESAFAADTLINGVLILAAGLLLLIPGIITDIAAVTLLFPPTRSLYRHWLKNKFSHRVRTRAEVIEVKQLK